MECKICFQEYNSLNRKPCITGCGHTFCESCISKLTPKICPKCRKAINATIINYDILESNNNAINTKNESESTPLIKRILIDDIQDFSSRLNFKHEQKQKECNDLMKSIKEQIKNETQQKIDNLIKKNEKLLEDISYTYNIDVQLNFNILPNKNEIQQQAETVKNKLNTEIDLKEINKLGETLVSLQHKIELTISKLDHLNFKPNNPIELNCELSENNILLSCSSDNTIKVWNSYNGESIRTLKVPKASSEMVILNDELIAFGCDDNSIKIYDRNNGILVRTLPINAKIKTLAVLKDENLIACLIDGSIRIINNLNGTTTKILIGHTDTVFALTILNDYLLASGSKDETIKIWNSSNGSLVRTLNGHSGSVMSLVLLNSMTLASGSRDTTIKLWNINTGKLINTLYGHTSYVAALTVLKDGKLVSGSGDKTIKIWNSMDLIRTLNANDPIYCLAILKDGITLASGSFNGTIKLWNVNNGILIKSLKSHTESVTSLAVLT